jgi:hypothetical protein
MAAQTVEEVGVCACLLLAQIVLSADLSGPASPRPVDKQSLAIGCFDGRYQFWGKALLARIAHIALSADLSGPASLQP